MAATSFGQIDHFDPDNEGIESYLERVKLYFQANGIADAKRVPVCLSVIGGKNYAPISIPKVFSSHRFGNDNRLFSLLQAAVSVL